MLDAAIYSQNTFVQKDGAEYIISNYLPFLKWGRSETILDVGTGDGSVLFEVLLPKLPKHLRKIVLLDINENMLEVARTRSGDNSTIECVLFDIGSPVVPVQLLLNFDHIFSFYCLNWVMDQRQAIQNLFDMLKSGGDMLLAIVANHVVFDIYENMSKFDNWAHLKKCTTPYQHSSNADKEMEILLKDVGFADYRCEVAESCYTYGSFIQFYDWALGVNPFIKQIPQEEHSRYKEDYLSVAKNLLKLGEGGELRVTYKTLIVFASKPIE